MSEPGIINPAGHLENDTQTHMDRRSTSTYLELDVKSGGVLQATSIPPFSGWFGKKKLSFTFFVCKIKIL
jgi:hypothetical protein